MTSVQTTASSIPLPSATSNLSGRPRLRSSTKVECKALFFPDTVMPCRSFLKGEPCKRRQCTFAHSTTSLTELLATLASARNTIEVCVFTITCNEIADALEMAAAAGVMVRVITDDEQAKSQGSDVARLSRVKNITVRHDGNATSHMHHKFAIVDGSVLINGSFKCGRRHRHSITPRSLVDFRASSHPPLCAKIFFPQLDSRRSPHQ